MAKVAPFHSKKNPGVYHVCSKSERLPRPKYRAVATALVFLTSDRPTSHGQPAYH